MATADFTRFMTVSALTVALHTSALAQGTEAQREACTPDAFRLCSMAMPDPGRVEGCLRNAGPQLSAACYAVFFPPVAAAPPRPQRGQRPAMLPPPRLPSDDDDD